VGYLYGLQQTAANNQIQKMGSYTIFYDELTLRFWSVELDRRQTIDHQRTQSSNMSKSSLKSLNKARF
jgi:hypothetical protein